MSDKSIEHLGDITKGYFNIPIKDNPEADFVWSELSKRQFTNLQGKASSFFHEGWEKLGISVDQVPQIAGLHEKVSAHTDWSISPTDVEYTNVPDWFGHLSNKNFVVTTFIRSKENLHYTPFPDMFHDAFGHLPFLILPRYAKLVHRFGEIYNSLPEEKREAFSKVWWYTIEFGLIMEEGEMKALGAGLISSVGELNNAFSDKVEIVPFDAELVAGTQISDHEFHQRLFLLESFEQLENEVEKWAK